jgi:hypothetical protein
LEVIRSDIVFAQNWALLLKEADQELIFKATDKMKTYLYNFRPNEMPAQAGYRHCCYLIFM